jgi:hypothetical protein
LSGSQCITKHVTTAPKATASSEENRSARPRLAHPFLIFRPSSRRKLPVPPLSPQPQEASSLEQPKEKHRQHRVQRTTDVEKKPLKS